MFRDYLAHIHCAHKHLPLSMELAKLLNEGSLQEKIQNFFTYYKDTITKKPDKQELQNIVSSMLKDLSEILEMKIEDEEVDIVKLFKSYLAFATENMNEVIEKIIRIKRLGIDLKDWLKRFLQANSLLRKLANEVFSGGKITDTIVDDLRAIRGIASNLEKEIVMMREEVEEKIKGTNIEMAILEEIKDLKASLYMCEELAVKMLSGVVKLRKVDLLIDLIGNLFATIRHILEILVILYA